MRAVAERRETPQSRCISAVLRDAKEALTAEEILLRAREHFPRMALTTVYRNLERMCGRREAERTMFRDGIARYASASPGHQHALVCLGCRRSVDLDECPIRAIANDVTRETGFTIAGHQFELYGYCPNCQEKKPGSKQ